HNPPVLLVRFAQHVPPNRRHHEVSELEPCNIICFRPKIEACDAACDVLGAQIPGATKPEIRPGQFKSAIESRVAPLSNDHASAIQVADLEAETFYKHIEAEHIGVERCHAVPAQMHVLADGTGDN